MRTRTYPVDAVRVVELVSRLVAENDWEVRTRREPLGLLGAGQINALVMRPLGWRDEVAIRVVGRLDGARVDMRSRAPDGAFDFGGNGPRIEETLLALDGRITRLMRDAPDARPGEEAEAPPAEAAGD
jgi:hypothetical protein